jgi:hypothetical protein
MEQGNDIKRDIYSLFIPSKEWINRNIKWEKGVNRNKIELKIS